MGDTLARWVYNNEPAKFAAIELVPKTDKDVPETLLGHMNSDGTVSGGIPIPGLASWLSDPSDGKNTIVEGREANPSLGTDGAGGRESGLERADDRGSERRAPRVGRHGRARRRCCSCCRCGTA